MSNKVVTRDCVSDNFRLFVRWDPDKCHDKKLLLEITDHWKIIFLEKFQLTKGNIIGLGVPLVDIYYFGALLAACELGLKLVVLDLFFDRWARNSKNNKFVPMDLFICGPKLSDDKKQHFRSISRAFAESTIWHDYNAVHNGSWSSDDLWPRESDELLLCTSSGTTDTPKKIRHTHGFLYEVSARNQKVFKFEGNVLHLRNLHHGSSLAVYFLPALMSDQATSHHSYDYHTVSDLENVLRYSVTHDINHIHFPHTDALDHFLKLAVQHKVKFKNLTLYTLSYINPEWLPMIEACDVKQIISIFGCNETSGPVLINSLSPGQTDFVMNEFRLADDFYDVSLNENNQLVVNLATYNKDIVMQDLFEQQNEKFIHRGRSDLIRINDIEIELFYILNLCDKHNIDGQCTVDKQYERIYLALWADDPNAMDVLNQDLSKTYNETIRVYQHKILKKSDYMVGIKLDHDLIREEFRNEESTSNRQ